MRIGHFRYWLKIYSALVYHVCLSLQLENKSKDEYFMVYNGKQEPKLFRYRNLAGHTHTHTPIMTKYVRWAYNSLSLRRWSKIFHSEMVNIECVCVRFCFCVDSSIRLIRNYRRRAIVFVPMNGVDGISHRTWLNVMDFRTQKDNTRKCSRWSESKNN